jgi:hypothetical protein
MGGVGNGRWIIFAVNQKGHDWGNQVANSVGHEYPVIVVRRMISGWREPKKRPLRTRITVIPTMAKGVNYDIWHIPERVSGFSAFLHELNKRRIAHDLMD